VDISERKINELRIQAAERQAAENESIYKLLLDHSPEMIILSPFDASRRYVSPAVERMTGFTAEEYLAFEKLEMIHPKDRETARGIIVKLRQGNLVLTFRYRTLQKEGGYCWVEATVNGYLDPVSRQVAGYVAVIRDISMEKEREEQLASEHLRLTEAASLDELTGIPNRRAFNRAIEGEARRHTRETSELSLMMVDVDYFKRYNDFYGHVAGDACLRSVATALKAIVNRAADMVARFGGEEFVVLLPMTKAPGAERISRKIQQAICSLAIPHSESPYGTVTVSIGIATWQSEIAVSESLLVEQADRALYQAKERGRNQYVVG
jgi:diguanylate cyclase (GGDEF)-like protein/PAS domain S-box-containing protein